MFSRSFSRKSSLPVQIPSSRYQQMRVRPETFDIEILDKSVQDDRDNDRP